MNRLVRATAAIVAAIALVGSAACSTPTPQEKAAAEAQEQRQKAAEDQREKDKKQEDRLLQLVREGHWNETRTAFTRGGKHYVFASTGQVMCSPKFQLIAATTTSKEHYVLVAIMKQEKERIADKNIDGVLVGNLPEAFAANKKNLTKKGFEDLVRQFRDGNDQLRPICNDRP